ALSSLQATSTTEFSTLSLHDALPILDVLDARQMLHGVRHAGAREQFAAGYGTQILLAHGRVHGVTQVVCAGALAPGQKSGRTARSEEHTSELQSREKLVCRLLLEKKK